MSRLPGLSLLAVLLLAAACSRSPDAAAAIQSAAPAAVPAPTASPVPAASVAPAAPAARAEEHLLDQAATQPAFAVDPVPPQATAAGSGLPVPGRKRKPLVRAGSEAPAMIPLGSEIPEGPVAAADAPVQRCGDSRPAACSLDYKPVCADVDTGVRCITTPCPSSERKTFSSACKACRDPKVDTYVSGTCPKG